MRFAVTGGRNYSDSETIALALSDVPRRWTLIHGAATGADTLAARLWDGPKEAHPAEWQRYGKSAGPIRNKEMAESGIEMLLAFPGGKGTEHMKEVCRSLDIPVIEYDGTQKMG